MNTSNKLDNEMESQQQSNAVVENEVCQDDQFKEIKHSRMISEEHRIWTYNTLLLYDLVMAHSTEWPSLTVSWIPSLNEKANGGTGQTLCIGSHTSNDEQNYLLLVEVTLPSRKIALSNMHYEVRSDYEGFGFGVESEKKFNITSRIPHQGEVNRVAYLPQNPAIISSRGPLKNIYIWDCCKFRPDTSKFSQHEHDCEVSLIGHSAEGWGMSWNECHSGMLASVADDSLLCVWDINIAPKSDNKLDPIYSFICHKKAAQDVSWIPGGAVDNVLMTVGDDGHIISWDLRQNCKRPATDISLSNFPLNSLSINGLKPHIVATGGFDQQVYICDLRRNDGSVHRMTSHLDAIIRVHWSGFKEGLLASASTDRFISLWDIERVGMEQSSEDAEDGPPELIFSHGGHRAPVSDFAWNNESKYQWMIASVSEDNSLQIWQPCKAAFEDKEDDDTSDDDNFEVE